MWFFRFLSGMFFFPGNFVLQCLNVSIEQDEGMFRSMINMLYWGLMVVIFAMPWMFRMTAL